MKMTLGTRAVNRVMITMKLNSNLPQNKGIRDFSKKHYAFFLDSQYPIKLGTVGNDSEGGFLHWLLYFEYCDY